VLIADLFRLRKRSQPTFPDGPGRTHWITYSQRAELPSRIKSNFATWTRLGLFTISTPTRYLSLTSTSVARKVEYEPALLDSQSDDVHVTLGGLPASKIDVTPATKDPDPKLKASALRARRQSRNALS
jgi:hypothetical protein